MAAVKQQGWSKSSRLASYCLRTRVHSGLAGPKPGPSGGRRHRRTIRLKGPAACNSRKKKMRKAAHRFTKVVRVDRKSKASHYSSARNLSSQLARGQLPSGETVQAFNLYSLSSVYASVRHVVTEATSSRRRTMRADDRVALNPYTELLE